MHAHASGSDEASVQYANLCGHGGKLECMHMQVALISHQYNMPICVAMEGNLSACTCKWL